MTAGVHAELTADGQDIVLAVAGDDWELDRAAAALRRITPLLVPTSPPGMLRGPATWSCVTQLAHTFHGNSLGSWLPGPRLRDWILAEFEARHRAVREDPAVPAGLALRGYQRDAAAMIAATGKFLLFDDPGLGKTVTTIAGLRLAEAHGAVLNPMVIVVPSWEVADVWAREIAAWAPGWPPVTFYQGTGRSTAGARILAVTYATARIDAASARGPLARLGARAVVIDEAHYCKHEDAKQTQAVTRIAARAPVVVALTGTPVTKDTGDIFPVMAAMDPRSYPSRKRFKDRWLDVRDDGYSERIEGLKPVMEAEFFTVLAGQHRRAAKADVLPELPPKVYSVRRVQLPPPWRRAYDTMRADMLAEMPPDIEDLPVMSVLAQLTRLSQLASSACDVSVRTEINEYGAGRKVYDVTMRAPSWKADALAGILAERPGQRVAVFTVSRQLAVIAGAACEAAGKSVGWILGGQGQRQRAGAIADFQDGGLDVIIATSKAGGLGITLTAAGTVVMLQRDFEYDKAVQPEDRAHRIGQRHDMVEIIDVVAAGTVDERVREVLRVKGGYLGQLVRDPRIVRELLGGLR